MVATSATLAALREAIRGRRVVRFRAKGHIREFSPHVLGTKDGAWRVFGWQSGGGSGTRLKAGGDWRCFAVADVVAVETIVGAWNIGPATGEYGLNCVDLIDTAADMEFAANSLRRSRRPRHQD
jgi:hypothetical protein